MALNRRQFFAHSAAWATTAAAVDLSTALSAEPKAGEQLPIIDCHQHLWDLEKFKLPWIVPGTLLGRSYWLDDYAAAAKGLGVAKAVYMEVDVDPAQQQAEAETLIEICQSGKHPTVAAVISGRPASEGFKPYITRLKESRYIKGVRQVLHAGSAKPGMCLQDDFVRGIQLLGELGLSFDLCMRAKELSDGAKLADRCPDTRFILDHCGNADPKAFVSEQRRGDASPEHDAEQWKKDIGALAERKNVICKISGIIARAPKQWPAADVASNLAPAINHCLDSFGPDRVIFGSDWPVCLLGGTYRQWVEALRSIIAERPLAEQRKLLAENAERFYGLK